MTTRRLGRPCHFLPSVDSTNTILKRMAAEGAQVGTLVITDYQSRGKGRGNRRWEAPAETSLLFSLLFRPNWPARQAAWLTMMAGVAAARAVETETPLRLGLKWPNDLMLRTERGWSKTGGILIESVLDDDQLQQAILGVGLNVNIPEAQLPQTETPATSLLVVTGQTVPRLPLLVSFLHHLERLYDAAAAGRSPQPDWNDHLIMLNQPVRVDMGKTMLSGTVEGADDWGRLLLRDASGALHTIAAGDVRLRDFP